MGLSTHPLQRKESAEWPAAWSRHSLSDISTGGLGVHVLPRTIARWRMMRLFIFVMLAAAASLPGAGAAQPASAGAITLAGPRNAQGKYAINAGDELDIFVWGEERMQRAVRVQPDGTFTFPLAGSIVARGRDVGDVAAEIRERISTNYRSAPPDVTVSVREATGMRFYVLGKVRTPGSFTSGSAPNVLQALSLAGGPADFADLRNAVILRKTAAGEVVEHVQIAKLLKGGRTLREGALHSALPVLLSGDVLVVP